MAAKRKTDAEIAKFYDAYDRAYVKRWDKGLYMKKKLSKEEYTALYRKMEMENAVALAETGKVKYTAGIAGEIKNKQTSVYNREHMATLVRGFRQSVRELDDYNRNALFDDYPELKETMSRDKEQLIELLMSEDAWTEGTRKQMFDFMTAAAKARTTGEGPNYLLLFNWVVSPEEEFD